MVQLFFLVFFVTAYTSHSSLHAAEKPRPKDFQTNGTLISHEQADASGQEKQYYKLLHKGEVFYATQDCANITKKKSYLFFLLSHPGPHKCSDCSKVFSRPDTRDRHYKNKHLNLRPHSCECGHRFKRSDHLMAHRQTQNHLSEKGFASLPKKHLRVTDKKRLARAAHYESENDTDQEEQSSDASNQSAVDTNGCIPAPIRKSSRLAALTLAGKRVSFEELYSDKDEVSESDTEESPALHKGPEKAVFENIGLFSTVESSPLERHPVDVTRTKKRPAPAAQGESENDTDTEEQSSDASNQSAVDTNGCIPAPIRKSLRLARLAFADRRASSDEPCSGEEDEGECDTEESPALHKGPEKGFFENIDPFSTFESSPLKRYPVDVTRTKKRPAPAAQGESENGTDTEEQSSDPSSQGKAETTGPVSASTGKSLRLAGLAFADRRASFDELYSGKEHEDNTSEPGTKEKATLSTGSERAQDNFADLFTVKPLSPSFLAILEELKGPFKQFPDLP